MNIKYITRISISLIKPNAGEIDICASGWLENRKGCWDEIISPPRHGSKEEGLKCLSEVVVVIHPANTGNDRIDEKEVGKIDRGNKGKNKAEWIIER